MRGVFKRFNESLGRDTFGIRYLTPSGRRRKELGFITKRQAEDQLLLRKYQIKEKTYRDPIDNPETEALTFSAFADQFLEKYGNLRRSDHYTDRIKPLKAKFGARALKDIIQADLDGYLSARLRQEIGSTGRKVSACTVKKDRAVMITMFKMAKEWRLIDVNPAEHLMKLRLPEGKTRYLSREEVDRLIAEAVVWLKPILTMAVSTGMRLKEVVGIRWEDVDREADAIHLSDDNKTARTRSIPLSTTSRTVLAGQVRHLRSPYVFVDAEGQPYTSASGRDRVTRETTAAMKRASIEGATFKTLRHTAASLMVQAGVPLYEVQKILGHSTPTMTQRYAHLAPGHLRGATDKLDGALRGSVPSLAPSPETAPEAVPEAESAAAAN